MIIALGKASCFLVSFCFHFSFTDTPSSMQVLYDIKRNKKKRTERQPKIHRHTDTQIWNQVHNPGIVGQWGILLMMMDALGLDYRNRTGPIGREQNKMVVRLRAFGFAFSSSILVGSQFYLVGGLALLGREAFVHW